MSEELVRQIDKLERRIDSLIKPEVSRQLVAPFLDIPGKVGLWYAGDVQRSTGNIYDASGQGRTLTYNGNPIFKQLDNGIAYCDLDGTGDLFSRPDETDLDILGTEAHNVGGSPGLTVGGYFWQDALGTGGTPVAFLSKWAGGGQSYMLDYAGVFRFIVSNTGADLFVESSGTATINTWNSIFARFTPSSELALFINGVKTTNVVSIPASIFNGSAPLNIGAFNGVSRLLNGRFSIGFLSANALTDAYINSLFQQTRVFYGV